MNTYTLRCGEVVPLGVECALPPPGRESATREWVRTLAFAVLCFLPGLAVFNPAIQDWLSPDAPIIEVSPADPDPARNSLMCPP